MNEQSTPALTAGLSPRGFLSADDPLTRLPAAFDGWEQRAAELPKWLPTGRVRELLTPWPAFDVEALTGEAERERAMMLLSYLGHAWVWGEEPAAQSLPAGLAVPWHAVARKLGREPVLSYASYALHNWRRLDPAGPVALGNIVLLQNFLAGQDEEWFILVHVDIEARAGAALNAAVAVRAAVEAGDAAAAESALNDMAAGLGAMYEVLCRMPERCDPHAYFHRVRPYIHGWKNNPATPEGVIYEGVDEYGGRPVKLAGETGAQSSIIPSMDAILGVAHADDPLRPYLLDMRRYMPPAHRAFIEALEAGPSTRDFVRDRGIDTLADAYDACVTWVTRFRDKHLEFAASYINRQAQISLANPSEVGTGSTPFMPYLRKHRDETGGHRLRGVGE